MEKWQAQVVFNFVLMAEWAIFLWYTLTPRWSKKITFLCYIPICILAFLVPWALPVRSAARYASTPLIFLASAFIFYRSRPARTIFCAVLPDAAVMMAEVLNILVFPSIYRDGFIQDKLWMNVNTVVMSCYYLPFYTLLLFVAASLIGKTRCRLSAKQWIVFMLFPVSQTLNISFSFDSMFEINPTDAKVAMLTLILVLSVVADIALLMTMSKTSRKAELEVENRMLGQQLNAQISHYHALTEQYETNRRIRHDIMHHVRTIQLLLERGEHDEAAEYAQQFISGQVQGSQLGSCENPVIDAFLCSRVQEARDEGIGVDAAVKLPAVLPVSNTDLVLLFGNLMDNAVEACIGQESPYIRLDAYRSKGFLVIKECNPTGPAHEAKKRRIPELDRGVGKHIMETVAEKYDGSCDFTIRDGVFSASIYLRIADSDDDSDVRMAADAI